MKVADDEDNDLWMKWEGDGVPKSVLGFVVDVVLNSWLQVVTRCFVIKAEQTCSNSRVYPA